MTTLTWTGGQRTAGTQQMVRAPTQRPPDTGARPPTTRTLPADRAIAATSRPWPRIPFLPPGTATAPRQATARSAATATRGTATAGPRTATAATATAVPGTPTAMATAASGTATATVRALSPAPGASTVTPGLRTPSP